MGKRLIQQARGKGGPRYRAPSFKYKGKVSHRKLKKNIEIKGEVIDLVRCSGHTAPLAQIKFNDDKIEFVIAPEGIKVGDQIIYNKNKIKTGNVEILENIPEGTLIHNIEKIPGDGGKFVRASGTFAKVISKMEDKVIIMLPSKKKKTFNKKCRASIGVISGGGRTDKPILKAGKKYRIMKSKNKLWPIVSGASMNAVDHPYGNSRSLRKGRAKPTPRNAPPGRKVGQIAPRKTGRKKLKK